MTQTPTGKTHHIHGTPVFMQRAKTGIVFLWGENERLKAYDFDLATKRITKFRGEGAQFASGNMPAPGGMPGGRLVGSSNANTVGGGQPVLPGPGFVDKSNADQVGEYAGKGTR